MNNRRLPSAFVEQFRPGEIPAQTNSPSVGPMQPVQQEQPFFNIDLVRSLYLHRKLAMGIVAVSLVLAAAYVVVSWPIYTAQSQIYIQPAPPRMMETVPTQHWPFDANTYESYIQQQVHNITRGDVLLAAVRKLPGGTWRNAGESEQAAADRLGHAVEAARIGTSYQISITARAAKPALAAQIANAVASSFVESAKSELRAGDTERIALLSEERDRVVKELAADRTEQEQLNKQLGVAAIGTSTPDPYDEQINAVRGELVKARTASDEAAARLTSLATGNSPAALDAEADDLVNVDAGLVSLKTSMNARRAVLVSQMANLTPNHPQYKQDAEELAHIDSSLEAMMKELRVKAGVRIQQKLRSDLERTSSIEARLNAQLAQLTGAAGGATPRLQRSNELANDIQRLQNRFSAVDEQFRNLTMENNAPGADYISAPAVPPLHATQTGVLRNAFVLVFAGLIVAIVAAIAANNLDQRIYIAADVERILGFGPMAQLPDFYQVSDGVAEEYMLRVAAAIEHAYQQGGMKSCIFTGVTPGAGATTAAGRVRTLLEAMGRSTLLVDASGTPPPEPERAEPGEKGTTDLVASQRGRRPTALLQRMADETGEDTIVLTDTAPLLVSGETEYLARFVDSAIVIIDSGATTRAQLREAAQTLQRLEVASVGFVLNRIALEKANPAFRQSVNAVERHVKMQNLIVARRTVKSRPAAEPIAEKTKVRSEESQPKAGQSTGAARSITPQPVSAPEPSTPPHRAGVIEPPVFGVVDMRSAQPLTPRPLRAPQPPHTTIAAIQAAKPRQPAEEPLRETLVREKRPKVQSPPMPVQSAPPAVRTAEPIPPTVAANAAPQQIGSKPMALTSHSPLPPPPAPRIMPEPEAAALPEKPAAPPKQAEPQTVAQPPVMSQPVAETNSAELDDVPYSAASRLGGLRNLLVTLGLNNMYTVETISPEPPNHRMERGSEHSVSSHAHSSLAVADDPAPGPVPARLVAQPEFLPPKPVTEITGQEKEPAHSAPPAAQRNNLWREEDIEILPSWRGQYRRKRSS